MKKITRWRPDTCGCELEFEWDNEVSLDKRTHLPGKYVVKCAAHNHIEDNTRHFESVLEENRRKNQTLTILKELPLSFVEQNTTGKATVKVFKEGYEPVWSFDENRKLIIHLPNTTPEDKFLVSQIDFSDRIEIK